MKEDKQKIKGRFHIYKLYIWKKIRDSRIRTKLYAYLALSAVVCSVAIGGMSYMSMRKALTLNAQDSAVSLMKQIGTRMDERVYDFQDASYSLSHKKEIMAILDGTDEEGNKWNHTLDEAAFNSSMFMYNILYKYSDFAVMESGSGEVYVYNQVLADEKIGKAKAKEVLDLFRDEVSGTSPVKWTQRDGQVYFIRRMTPLNSSQKTEDKGIIIFAVSDSFFDCGDDANPFVENKNIVVAGSDGLIYRNNELELKEEDLQYYLSYEQGKYYIYTTTKRIAEEQYLAIPLRTVKYQWNIMCFIPYSVIMEKANQVIPKVIVTMLVILCVGMAAAYALYRMIEKNLKIIETGMRQYETGNYSKVLSPASYDEIGMLILQFNHMGLKINELNELARRDQEEKQELQYQVMEAQINPHFLYNTLGSLKWLAYEKEQEEIARLADALINLLRFTVKNANKFIYFRDEIDYIKNYVYIQKQRYEDAFTVEYDVTKEAGEFSIIGFILQPFIENSILHGLDNSRNDGVIRIEGKVLESRLHIAIKDNGMGMPKEKLVDLRRKMQENKTEKYKGFNGIGIINIIQRLKMIYQEGFIYEIDSIPGKGTTVTMIIPGKVREDEKTCIDCGG